MRLIASFILFALLLSLAANAFVMSNPDYRIVGTMAGGGEKMIGGSYKMYLSVAQPAISPTKTSPTDPKSGYMTDTGSLYKLCLGVFCTNVFDIPRTIKVSGTIKYDTGGEVSNSEAKLIISYGQAKYESKTIRTNDKGEFTVTTSVPEAIANKNFVIEVYAKGKVEASYTCTFDQATNHCT